MRINNEKIKKNIDAERNKKINKYRNELIKLFDDLLNKRELSSLFDDVKISYIHFIDKAIIYLDNLENEEKTNTQSTNTKQSNNNETKIFNITNNKSENNENNNDDFEDVLFNDKITNMMNKCYDKRYYEMIVENNEEQLCENIEDQVCDDDDEDNKDDEDDEY
jgi:hypothetical protein